MNESGSCVCDIKDSSKISEAVVIVQEPIEEEEEFHNEDKELYDKIREIVKNRKKAKIITKICLEWVDEQVTWGGKYDYLLEEAAGDDV